MQYIYLGHVLNFTSSYFIVFISRQCRHHEHTINVDHLYSEMANLCCCSFRVFFLFFFNKIKKRLHNKLLYKHKSFECTHDSVCLHRAEIWLHAQILLSQRWVSPGSLLRQSKLYLLRSEEKKRSGMMPDALHKAWCWPGLGFSIHACMQRRRAAGCRLARTI